MNLKDRAVGFALTGSFCTLEQALGVMARMVGLGARVWPIMSFNVYGMDTRFFKAEELRQRVADICGRDIIHTLQQAEPIGPQALLDLLVIAPCTGNTMAKLALGITDTPVTMAAKAHLRNSRPLVVAPSTNDGLSASAKNLAALSCAKGVYIAPYAQDDPLGKPTSLVALWDGVIPACEAALAFRQLQPVLG